MSNSHIENFVNAVTNKISAVVNNHNSSSNAHSSLLSDYLQTTDVKDNLTSTDTNKPLSAKQGTELKTLVDGKSDNNHTHEALLSSNDDSDVQIYNVSAQGYPQGEGQPLGAFLSEFWKKIYPVGSIYISVNSTSPQTLFGGTWEQIQDRFLLASGSTYSAGAIGGEATHKLTINEMPSHTHIQNSHNHTQNSHNHTQNAHNHALTGSKSVGLQEGDRLRVGYGSTSDSKNTNNATATNKATTATNNSATATNNPQTATNQNTGGGQAHNNMPPYLTVFMWKRTA
ncbi:MAG: hypothetical protein Q4Q24_00300 [Methanobrevibacter ruminantium]|uniref:phage baseplate protein n=1 Tax=Methanobrevibacter ruminantium TaxID=83816 RepID=UPI0026EBC9EB|nr:hypothetical protein [Methanobrevibacter ruminantium]MDO5841694.1 hypothetical protein [Methanobrevibacter ruminantium]